MRKFILLILLVIPGFLSVAQTYVNDTVYIADHFVETKLLNREKLFKKIYRAAKKSDLLTGKKIFLVIDAESTGEISGVHIQEYDTIYNFIEAVFKQYAIYSPAIGSSGKPVFETTFESIEMSEEFLLNPREPESYQETLSETNTNKITSFDKEFYLKVEVSEIYHNGVTHKVSIDVKEKITNQESPLIKLNDNVAIYLEFPQVQFKNEKYYICNYYIKEKINGVWATRCNGVLNNVKTYGNSFLSGATCGAADDSNRLEIKMDLSLDVEE